MREEDTEEGRGREGEVKEEKREREHREKKRVDSNEVHDFDLAQ